MKSWPLWRVLVAGAVICHAQHAIACSFATGYFHQVTRLRGSVVGTDNYWPALGYHSYPRWLRHRVVKGNVSLHLYEYRFPLSIHQGQPVATVSADKEGRFDFGTLPEGHYTLMIGWPVGYSDLFDVEITSLPVETVSVLIDVSPVNPDCTGGHEFIVYSSAAVATGVSALSLTKAALSEAVFAVVLFAPAVLVLLGWRHWRRRTAETQYWRRVVAVTGLLAASTAWLLLAALELPMPYVRHVYGQGFVESFWRHSLPVGLLLSVFAMLLVLFGRGRARVYSLIGALGMFSWWWFLGLLD
jgi:hypothetical protein